MGLKAALSGFVVFLLSVQVVQGQDGWAVTYTPTEICASRGSTVDMRCTYKYPSRMNYHYIIIERTFWFARQDGNGPVDLKTDPQYSGRVDVQCGDNDCTLRITDLRESDSAEYKFRFITNQPGGRYSGLPGVTLSVTDPDLQVQVRTYSYSTWAELTCHSSCRLPARPSFVWYKNGEKIETQTSSSYSEHFGYADSYSCAVAGHEDSPSPPVCVRGQSCNKVTYAHRRICAFKGSSVDISCTYNSYETIRSKYWFSPGRSPLQYSDRVQVLDEGVRGQSCNKVTYAHRRICAFKGSSVDISCTYNSYESIRSTFWFSPGRSLQWQSPSQVDSQHRVQVLDEGGGRSTLRINVQVQESKQRQIQEQNSGQPQG
uniref:uncharacterized protein LOC124053495 n=1 Tax=Scatophagus argus TaxID=75038 RepID=UPI001ED8358F|nr:uncharacterized protein LOC124053495 [Scatophagus argus]